LIVDAANRCYRRQAFIKALVFQGFPMFHR
jgi:hypothetical protein